MDYKRKFRWKSICTGATHMKNLIWAKLKRDNSHCHYILLQICMLLRCNIQGIRPSRRIANWSNENRKFQRKQSKHTWQRWGEQKSLPPTHFGHVASPLPQKLYANIASIILKSHQFRININWVTSTEPPEPLIFAPNHPDNKYWLCNWPRKLMYRWLQELSRNWTWNFPSNGAIAK